MLLRAAFAALAVALITACSGKTSGSGGDAGRGNDGGLAPPTSHRPTHVSCMSTRPPGLQGAGVSSCPGQSGACTSDSQCPATNDAGGTNGRCTPFVHVGPLDGCPSCQYDQCATDSQCGTDSVCDCGGVAQAGRNPNACVSGDCQVDSDCGSGGYCSPNIGYCTQATLGYYCHTADDQCTNDSDCQTRPTGGECVYDISMKIWDCQNQGCAK